MYSIPLHCLAALLCTAYIPVRNTGGAPRGHARTIKTSWLTSPRYFAAYEVTKKALTPAGHTPAELHLGSIITAGGMAGVAMWAIAIPPDVR